MGVSNGIKARLNAGLGGLELDAQLKLIADGLDELNGRAKGLEEYLTKPELNNRNLVAALPVAAGPLPLTLDLGNAAQGLMWSVEQVVIGHLDPLATATAIANVAAAVFVGRPTNVTSATGPSPVGQCISASQPVPTAIAFGGRKGIVRRGDHLYVILAGSGLVPGDQWFATAMVTETVDTPTAMFWF
jgi:hypothetical protein